MFDSFLSIYFIVWFCFFAYFVILICYFMLIVLKYSYAKHFAEQNLLPLKWVEVFMKVTCIKGVEIAKQIDCSCRSVFEPEFNEFEFKDSKIVCTCPVCGREHVLVHPAHVSKLPQTFLRKIRGHVTPIMTWHE